MEMGDQPHDLTAVLPGKWVSFHLGTRAGPDRLEKEKISSAQLGFSNPTVQPVASHYTIYTMPPAGQTEGDGMSMAHSRGKNHGKL
jgi:hypothetical protein